MRGSGIGQLAPAALLLAPVTARAQEIPGWVAAGALSPLLVLVLAVIVGRQRRSWSAGATHVLLVLTWIGLFLLASAHVTNDYLIRVPLLAYALHGLLLVVLVVLHCVRGRRS
ncbi:MAG: hypothetical protein HKO62_00920 [Gammaproteobacteria bacterium]|nr:hypothetical protein [Gammaproteobacteria bacterium]NNL99278.1 hypothetical protein [Gammaproteobacteria bacterium]